MDKVDKKKEQFSKDREIYDLIQLSRIVLKFNHNILVATLILWEGSINNIQLRCAMVIPTLFYIASIVGLRPRGETFDPSLINNTQPTFDFVRASYKHFFQDFHEIETFDHKHNAFLTYKALSLCI